MNNYHATHYDGYVEMLDSGTIECDSFEVDGLPLTVVCTTRSPPAANIGGRRSAHSTSDSPFRGSTTVDVIFEAAGRVIHASSTCTAPTSRQGSAVAGIIGIGAEDIQPHVDLLCEQILPQLQRLVDALSAQAEMPSSAPATLSEFSKVESVSKELARCFGGHTIEAGGGSRSDAPDVSAGIRCRGIETGDWVYPFEMNSRKWNSPIKLEGHSVSTTDLEALQTRLSTFKQNRRP